MKNIKFDEIPAQGLQIEIDEASWFPAELRGGGKVSARLRLEPRGERVFCDGAIQATVQLSCDRCLAEMSMPLDCTFSLDVEVEKPTAAGSEHLCSASEMDTFFVPKREIDPGEILRQQVFLQLPAKALCRKDCKGLCPRCGQNLNDKRCDCEPESDSPFGALKTLLKSSH
ncbi:MAG: DUF177 domain-containing protein [Thermodesulfobacteriota bacterium]